MSENAPQQRTLTFNDDGTIDPAQLEGMSQEFIDKVTAPDFVIRARLQIAADKERQSFLRAVRWIKDRAQSEHEARRPSGVSGRQRKRLRRLAHRASVLGFKAKQEDASHGQERQLPDHQSSRIS